MLKQIHFLLTYACTFECDHCFLHCGPFSPGVFSLSDAREVLEQARSLGSVTGISLEGGEPFLH